jgi:hypothetical protein
MNPFNDALVSLTKCKQILETSLTWEDLKKYKNAEEINAMSELPDLLAEVSRLYDERIG